MKQSELTDVTVSVGIDLVEIDRIENMIEKWGGKFLNRCFTSKELENTKSRPHRLAGIFAVKESVVKAMGTGFRGFNLLDIEVFKGKLGEPILKFSDNPRIGYLTKNWVSVSISITHTKHYAAAVVTVLKRDDDND